MWMVWLILSLIWFGIFVWSLIRRGEDRKRRSAVLLTGLSLVVWLGFGGLFMWVTRPWWHWLWFNVFYMCPGFWIITIAMILVLSGIWLLMRNSANRREKERHEREKERAQNRGFYYRERESKFRGSGYSPLPFVITGVVLWAILIISLSVSASAITKTKIYHQVESEINQLDVLPETTKARYLPLEVALRYGENKVQESEVKLGDIDPIIFEDGEFSWVIARMPNGFWRSFSYNADGFALVRSDGNVQMISQQMKYGEGMYINDNISWKLRERRYWVNVPEIYYLLDGEEVIGIAPYLKYRFQFPVMVPYWGGVFVFHADGRIEDFTPEEAQQLSYVQGQRVFPETLARLQVESWGYKHGIWNAWFTHRDQLKIPGIQHSSNQMPFLLPTSEGPKWMVACEPYGQAFGVFKVFFIDAHTGEIELYEVPKDTSWVGPNAIWDYIKTAFPTYNWYRESGDKSSGNIIAIEPRPVIKQQKLYWMASVTNTQYGGVSETVLVDSHTPTNILSFKTKGELDNFLTGAGGPPPEEPTVPSDNISSKMAQLIAQMDQLLQQLHKLQQQLQEME